MHPKIHNNFRDLNWIFEDMTNRDIYRQDLGEIEQYVSWLENVIDCLDKNALACAYRGFDHRDKFSIGGEV